jgi:molybdate transport system substrate-binding protein
MGARGLKRSLALLLIGLALGAVPTTAFYQLTRGVSQKEVIVFAGAAAAPVYREAATLFELKYGVKVIVNLGGSGALLSALEISKTGDVYIPGSPEFLIQASQRGIVNFTISQPSILAYLVPAIIVQKGNPKNVTKLEDLARPGIRVAIGDPKSVCIGLYAKEILERDGLWEAVSKNLVTYAPSCEATAQLVYIGAVDAVIGWHVFYHWNPDKADIVWIEPDKIPRIGYIAGAVTTFARDKDLAAKFLDFLSSQDAHELWRKYGYFATAEEAKARAPRAVVEKLG